MRNFPAHIAQYWSFSNKLPESTFSNRQRCRCTETALSAASSDPVTADPKIVSLWRRTCRIQSTDHVTAHSDDCLESLLVFAVTPHG